MNVDLTPELEALVQGKIESGRYNSASEVVREALRLLEQRDEIFTHRRDEIGKQIEEGWQSAKRREFVDGGEVFDRIDAELKPWKVLLLNEAFRSHPTCRTGPRPHQELPRREGRPNDRAPGDEGNPERFEPSQWSAGNRSRSGGSHNRPLKFWPIYSYLIVYDPETKPVEIVRVVHGMRDLEGTLN
jgi:antitoxin ParD1/3/4